MKNIFLPLAAGLLAVSCIINISGGSIVGLCTEDGIDYTEIREVAAFNAISTSLPCNVYYSQADKQEVRVESTQEFAPKVLTEVDGEELKLRLEEGRYPKLILRVVITSPDIKSITVRGSGNLIHDGSLQASGDLDLKVSGSGDIKMGDLGSKDFTAHVSGSGHLRLGNLDCNEFSAHVSGSGSEHIGKLTCTGFSATLSGSGHINVEKAVVSDYAQARISGSGRVRLDDIAVDGDMHLSTSGSGHINVNGSCRNVEASSSGAGSISGNLSYEKIRSSTAGSGHVNL